MIPTIPLVLAPFDFGGKIAIKGLDASNLNWMVGIWSRVNTNTNGSANFQEEAMWEEYEFIFMSLYK